MPVEEEKLVPVNFRIRKDRNRKTEDNLNNQIEANSEEEQLKERIGTIIEVRKGMEPKERTGVPMAPSTGVDVDLFFYYPDSFNT